MLSHAVLRGENVCARLEVGEGREEIYILPALNWILRAGAEGKSRALVIVADADAAARAAAAVRVLGSPAGISFGIASESGASGPIAESLVLGDLGALLSAIEAGRLSSGDFGFLVVDGLDSIAEKDRDRMEALRSGLLPPWELRSVLVCSRVTGKARMLVRDLAENVSEISIDEKFIRMRGIASETYHIDGGAKIRFILGLAGRAGPESVIVFCNLADTAADLARRLATNGLDARLVNGAPPAARRGGGEGRVPGRGASYWVACDDRLPSLGAKLFPLIVNFDIPLDPELYGKRLAALDPGQPGSKVVNLACERYVYGLSAIESLVGFSLEAREVPASMLGRVDVSGRAAETRPVLRPGESKGERRQRSDSGAEAAPRIMLSVDEAAGRMTAQTMRAENGAGPARAAERVEQKPRAVQAKQLEKPARPGRQARQTLPPERKKMPLPQAPRLPSPPRSGTVVDPYSLSMEERLEGYRERYIGNKARIPLRSSPGAPRTPPAGGPVSERKQVPRVALSPSPAVEASPLSPRPEVAVPEARNSTENSSRPRLIPAQEAPGPGERTGRSAAGQGGGAGLFGKIAGLFKKNKNMR
jgi:ATP-dependent RNA helicase RhlB